MNNDSTIVTDDSLAHNYDSHNHAHHHNYNEIDPTLVCVGKSCPHQLNMSQISASNEITDSSSKELPLNNPSKGIFA